jgi:protein O-mannosyl-transferase
LGVRKKARATVSARPAETGWWFPLLLVIAGLLCYAGSFRGPFIFDDLYAVPDNRNLHQWPSWHAFVAPGESAAAGRPVVTWSLVLNFAFGGTEVGGYHAFNLALHLAATLILFGLVRRTLQAPRLASRWEANADYIALAVAMIWLVHPLQTEAVCYIIQRTELLVGVFYLATLYLAARAWDSPHPRRWQAASVVCCAIGMASKEVMVSAPVMVVLYDRAFRVDAWRSLFARRRFYLALAASWIVLIALMATQPRSRSVGLGLGMTSWEYARTQSHALWTYLQLSLWPQNLSVDYGTRAAAAWSWPGTLAAVVGVIGTVWAWFRMPALGFLGAWFFMILAPSSSVVPIVTEVAAERRMYLSLAALIVAIVGGGFLLVPKMLSRLNGPPRPLLQRYGMITLVAAIVLGLAIRTMARTADYETALAIWSDTVRKQPEIARAHDSLGKAWYDAGFADRAVPEYRRAMELDPKYKQAYNNLGAALATLGQHEEAIPLYQKAIALQPDYAAAHSNLAVAYATLHRDREAIEEYEAAARIDPNYANTRVNYAIFLYQRRKLDEAAQWCREAIAVDPHYANSYSVLGAVLGAQGDAAGAEASTRKALALDPQLLAAWENLAKLLTARAGPSDVALQDEAVRCAERAVRLGPQTASTYLTLATTLEVRGLRPQAAACLEHLLKLTPNNGDAHFWLGRLLAVQGRSAEADAHLSEALRLRPDLHEARDLQRQLRAGVVPALMPGATGFPRP